MSLTLRQRDSSGTELGEIARAVVATKDTAHDRLYMFMLEGIEQDAMNKLAAYLTSICRLGGLELF